MTAPDHVVEPLNIFLREWGHPYYNLLCVTLIIETFSLKCPGECRTISIRSPAVSGTNSRERYLCPTAEVTRVRHPSMKDRGSGSNGTVSSIQPKTPGRLLARDRCMS